MRMIMVIQILVMMAVHVLVPFVNVGVLMRMGMLVRVHKIAVPMLMRVCMCVHMSMLQRDGILYHQHGCGNHNAQCRKKLRVQLLSQQDHTEQHAEKRCN